MLLHNSVHVHDHFIPIPRGFVDHPLVTNCVGELSNDKYFDDGLHNAYASAGIVRIPQSMPIDAACLTFMGRAGKHG